MTAEEKALEKYPIDPYPIYFDGESVAVEDHNCIKRKYYIEGWNDRDSLVEPEKEKVLNEYIDRLIKRIQKSKTISGLVKTHIYVLLTHQDK